MKDLLQLNQDIESYIKSINFTILKAHWRLSEESKREGLREYQKKLIIADMARLLSITKQLNDLEVMEVNKIIS